MAVIMSGRGGTLSISFLILLLTNGTVAYTVGDRQHVDYNDCPASCNVTHTMTLTTGPSCYCDDQCTLYGDCCGDYPTLNSDGGMQTPTQLEVGTYQCLLNQRIAKLSIYMVNKCPNAWADDVIRGLCQEDDVNNGIGQIPVSATHGGRVLFKNIFCAACHGEYDTMYWQIGVTCNEEVILNMAKMGTDISNTNLTLLEKRGCEVNFKPPNDQTSFRYCQSNIDTCGKQSHSEMDAEKCEKAPVSYVNDLLTKTTYRNVACARCNGIVNGTSCGAVTHILTSPFEVLPLSILLDLNSGQGDFLDLNTMVGRGIMNRKKIDLKTCSHEEVYDPFSGICRKIRCGPPFQLIDGECISNEKNTLYTDETVSRMNEKNGCKMVHLNSSEYNTVERDSIFVPAHGRFYQSPFFTLSNGGAFICTNFTQNYTYGIFWKFSDVQGIVSAVGQSLSVTALATLLLIYIMLPGLRNLPGKNLMCLVTSLLAAQLLFLTGITRTGNESLCYVIAVAIHYFFLAAFFWMNVMSYDIWRTFSRTASKVIGNKDGLFYRYSFYAWLFPLMIVASAAIVDVLRADANVNPDYARGVCWITNRKALLLFFASPLALILITNLVLYILTVRSIVYVSHATKLLDKKQEKRRLVLYVKLSSIMGLTWIFGFLATATNNNILWWLFVILNSTQGFFVAISFICTKKVVDMLKEKFGYMKKRRGTLSSDTGTKSTSLLKRLSSTEVKTAEDSPKQKSKRLSNLDEHETIVIV